MLDTQFFNSLPVATQLKVLHGMHDDLKELAESFGLCPLSKSLREVIEYYEQYSTARRLWASNTQKEEAEIEARLVNGLIDLCDIVPV